MSQPVFVGTAFTGQPVTADEKVECPGCGELCGLRSTGWFDQYREESKASPAGGVYVHFGCLSQRRFEEVNEVHAVAG
jgi:hypothetical protein